MPRHYFPDLHAIDPFSPPDWRWERALDLHSRNKRSSLRHDDASTLHALGYLRDAEGKAWDSLSPGTRRQYENLHLAHQIYQENGVVSWELEARVLAGQSSEEIGEKLRSSPAVIRLYEHVFFCCRDHLDAGDWIMNRVIRGEHWFCFAPDDLAGLWKRFARSGGPLVLDILIAASRPSPGQPSPYSAEMLTRARIAMLCLQLPLWLPHGDWEALLRIAGVCSRAEEANLPLDLAEIERALHQAVEAGWQMDSTKRRKRKSGHRHHSGKGPPMMREAFPGEHSSGELNL